LLIFASRGVVVRRYRPPPSTATPLFLRSFLHFFDRNFIMLTNTLRSDTHEAEQPQHQTELQIKPQTTLSITDRTRRFLKRNAFNLHRWISIVALVPTLLWALSGTAHPFMAHWFKPPIAREFLPPKPIDTKAVVMPLAEALKINGIAEIAQFRIVEFGVKLGVELGGAAYYQIQLPNQPERLYLNTRTGTRLQGGDEQYAVWLAKQYFSGTNGVATPTVAEKRVVTAFTDEYRSINRLLPVWKISFAEGGYDVFVETSSNRMATYNTPARKAYLMVFQYMHNWGWLNGAETLRVGAIVVFLSVIIVGSLSGVVLYAFLWNKRAKRTVTGLRKYHRSIGIAVSLTTLMFAASGMFHALHKDRAGDEAGRPALQATFKAEELNFGVVQAGFVAPPIFDVNVVKMPENNNNNGANNGAESTFYRFSHGVKNVGASLSDCCTPLQNTLADKAGKRPERIRVATYVNAQTGESLPKGDVKYAKHVAMRLAGVSADAIVRDSIITELKGEYGFVFKRLPVQRIDIASADKRALYVETATGVLSADVRNSDRLEGFSFAYVHKLEFLKPLGTDVRDGMAVALGFTTSLVAALGLVLFVRRKP
jgi:hypothetical protein